MLAAVNSEGERTTRELARSDTKGCFRCVVPPLVGNRPEYRLLVTHASGFAADWAEVRQADPARPIVLQLAKVTVPVRGRVLTLEGKPVPRAVVRLSHVLAPDGKNGLKQMYEKRIKERASGK